MDSSATGMGDARFDLRLLGYRSDLAQKHTAELLRSAGVLSANDPIDQEIPLPHRVLTAVEHDLGLHFLHQLRDCGADVELVPTGVDRAPASRGRKVARWGEPLLFLLLLGMSVLAYRQFTVTRRPIPPPGNWSDLTATRPSLVYPDARSNQPDPERQALALNAAGQFAEAAGRLRSAVENHPNRAQLRHNLKTVLHNWAIAELNAGNVDAAVGLLEEGLTIEEDPVLLSVLGIAHSRNAEWQDAQHALEGAVQLGAVDPRTLITLGTVYRQQGNREGAVEMLQRARAAGARGQGFDAMLRRLERELDAEWDFTELHSSHFQIAFADGENYEAAQIVVTGLEEAYSAVGEKLQFFPIERILAVLYPSEDFHHITQTPDWTGGVYDGRFKLPVRGLKQENPALNRTLRHEYGHVVVHQLSRGRCPVWLNEGVALWSEEERDGARISRAHAAIAGRQLFALQTLRQPFTRLPADRVQVAYAQGYLAVRALVDRYGADRLRQLLTTLGTGSSLETAFETVFTTRLATFEADLLRQLTG